MSSETSKGATARRRRKRQNKYLRKQQAAESRTSAEAELPSSPVVPVRVPEPLPSSTLLPASSNAFPPQPEPEHVQPVQRQPQVQPVLICTATKPVSETSAAQQQPQQPQHDREKTRQQARLDYQAGEIPFDRFQCEPWFNRLQNALSYPEDLQGLELKINDVDELNRFRAVLSFHFCDCETVAEVARAPCVRMVDSILGSLNATLLAGGQHVKYILLATHVLDRCQPPQSQPQSRSRSEYLRTMLESFGPATHLVLYWCMHLRFRGDRLPPWMTHVSAVLDMLYEIESWIQHDDGQLCAALKGGGSRVEMQALLRGKVCAGSYFGWLYKTIKTLLYDLDANAKVVVSSDPPAFSGGDTKTSASASAKLKKTTDSKAAAPATTITKPASKSMASSTANPSSTTTSSNSALLLSSSLSALAITPRNRLIQLILECPPLAPLSMEAQRELQRIIEVFAAASAPYFGAPLNPAAAEEANRIALYVQRLHLHPPVLPGAPVAGFTALHLYLHLRDVVGFQHFCNPPRALPLLQSVSIRFHSIAHATRDPPDWLRKFKYEFDAREAMLKQYGYVV